MVERQRVAGIESVSCAHFEADVLGPEGDCALLVCMPVTWYLVRFVEKGRLKQA